jgi:hypothetical protein
MFKSANHLTNNLIGLLLVSVLMFVLVYAIDRGNPQPAGRYLLVFLALMGLGALAGWMVLATRQILRSDRRIDR